MPETPTRIARTTEFDLALLTPEFLKTRYLIGLRLLGADGQELPDDVYQDWITTGISKLEELTNVDVLPREITAEKHDYVSNDYAQHSFFRLYHAPVETVREIRVVYVNGESLLVFPNDWLRLRTEHGQVQLTPTHGSLASVLIGSGGQLIWHRAFANWPNMFHFDYVSGFGRTAPDGARSVIVPRVIVDAICKLTVIELFTMMSDLVVPIGLSSASLSVDGLSQSKSFQTPAFKGRIDAYKQDLFGDSSMGTDGLIGQIKSTYFGIELTSA